MPNRYFIVSDLHLADREDHSDGWKLYKHSRYLIDQAFDEQVSRFLEDAEAGDTSTLVLNGDNFDFDLVLAVPEPAPWPVSPLERKHGLEPTEAKSIWKLDRILENHPGFMRTVARFVGMGHRLVCLAGNHDPELNFPGVQQALLDSLGAAADAEGLDLAAGHVRFESWFFYVPDEIYVEHGNQYDIYTSFRYVLSPFVTADDPTTIALSMGNISNRYMASQMGFFNPNASDFILNVFEYVTHWLRHYAFTRRSLAASWLVGSVRSLVRTLRTKRKVLAHPPDYPALLAQVAERNGLPVETVEALDRQKQMPIADRVYRIVREFWIDRLAISVGMVWGTIVLALLAIPLWIKVMVPLTAFPLVYVIYEWFAHGETIFSIEKRAQEHARAIARLLPVKIVTFGHTHVPGVIPILPGVSYVNTGTWAPWFVKTRSVTDKALKPGLRNVLVATFEGERAEVRLECNT